MRKKSLIPFKCLKMKMKRVKYFFKKIIRSLIVKQQKNQLELIQKNIDFLIKELQKNSKIIDILEKEVSELQLDVLNISKETIENRDWIIYLVDVDKSMTILKNVLDKKSTVPAASSSSSSSDPLALPKLKKDKDPNDPNGNLPN